MAKHRKFVDVKELKNGMKLEQDIMDSSGRTMIGRGSFLDDFQIKYITAGGLEGIYVESDEPEEYPEEEIPAELPPEVEEEAQKNREEDRAKVELSHEVVERVGEGVKYIFSNPEDESFMEASENVSNELISVIRSNDAVAVDINRIKVSDEYTFKHSVDVATMSMIIARNFGLSKLEMEELCVAGLLHDVGKSNIPLEVLNKPGRLTDDEFKIMRQHSLFGFKILKGKGFSQGIMEGVLEHHEKINGSGYPQGLPENRIHKYAKIIAVADVYDALVTERPYKKAFSKREAIEMIMAMTGEIDIRVMRAFLQSVILYPVDSVVHLSTGESARVLKNYKINNMRPVVLGLKTGKIYDLANDVNCASMIITD